MSICAWCKKELPGMDGSHGICKSCDVDMRRKAKLLRHDDDEPTTEIVVMHARCLWCGAAVPGDHGVRYVCPDCDSKYMSYADYEEAQERRRAR